METSTSTILETIGIVQSLAPAWAVPPMSLEILATMAIGIVATWTREIVRHYDEDSAHETDFWKCMVMIIPGIFAGILGGEIAAMAGYSPTDFTDPSWLFVATIGYIGPPAMNLLTQTILGIMQKQLEKWGIDYEKQSARKLKEVEEDEKRHRDMKNKFEDEQFKQSYEELVASVPEQD